ncbi:uncharacterized protein DEA37_0004293, partial [Paragonimus westermani]
GDSDEKYEYGTQQRHRNSNQHNVNPLTRINWRASLVPAAMVNPAPEAYIKVVAVTMLVVGSVRIASRRHPLSRLAVKTLGVVGRCRGCAVFLPCLFHTC